MTKDLVPLIPGTTYDALWGADLLASAGLRYFTPTHVMRAARSGALAVLGFDPTLGPIIEFSALVGFRNAELARIQARRAVRRADRKILRQHIRAHRAEVRAQRMARL
jgi:hypothetical protein